MKKFLISVTPIVANPTRKPKIPGYMISSTASINVEGDETNQETQFLSDPILTIKQIAEYIYKNSCQGKSIEIITQIHGFNTPFQKSKKMYFEANEWIQNNVDSDSHSQLIFFGYCWPSEGMKLLAWRQAYRALPLWLQIFMWMGFLISFLNGFYIIFVKPSHYFLVVLCAIAAVTFITLVITLMFLRLSTYFRDSYRANNYGVVDLIQFFKAFEQELFNVIDADPKTAKNYWNNNRIKLSFIGHSMGGFVVTSLVRSLSDVFDKNLVTSLEVEENYDFDQPNTSRIGDCFCLERLILVSPDIPLDSILSGRSNFLISSLIRFQECYLFSNEGDIVLLMASTAANYFIYPAKTSQKGYKLGNLGLRADGTDFSSKRKYGIVNLFDKMHPESFNQSVFNRLVIGVDHSYVFEKLNTLPKEDNKICNSKIQDIEKIAEQFTYFDCTDYDYKEIANSKKKWDLNLLDYVKLTIYYFSNSKNIHRDVHGGYFLGKFTRSAIYKLAFLGMKAYLSSGKNNLECPIESKDKALTTEDYKMLDIELKKHNIRVLFKPTLLPSPK
jgi:hypothetical protein